MSLRLLITTFTFPPQRNGVAHVAAAHAYGLARRGHDVTVATRRDPQRAGYSFPANVHVEEFDVSGNGQCILGGYRGEVDRYRRFIAGFDGDAILCHCWQIWSTDLAVPTFAQNGPRRILISHGVSAAWTDFTPKWLILRTLWQPYLMRLPWMMRRFDCCVFLTEKVNWMSFTDHRQAGRLGLEHCVIPNGVDLQRFEGSGAKSVAFRAKYGFGDAPMVLLVGHYGRMKDQAGAVRAFAGVSRPGVVLVMIGGAINEYARSVMRLAKEAASRKEFGRVLFLERLSQEEVAAAYCAADVFLCSSKLEVQPLVILDAMGAGTPFVSTDVGCVSEFPGGLVARSRRGLTEKLDLLLGDRELQVRLGQAGRKACETYYNWDHVVDEYDALLTRLCEARR